jgi:hypothetical protein
MTQLPPNWYPDPWNPQQQRYWDGQGWSDQVRSLLTPELIASNIPPASVKVIDGAGRGVTLVRAVVSMAAGILGLTLGAVIYGLVVEGFFAPSKWLVLPFFGVMIIVGLVGIIRFAAEGAKQRH